MEGELRRLISWLAGAEEDAGVVDEEPVVGELVEGGEGLGRLAPILDVIIEGPRPESKHDKDVVRSRRVKSWRRWIGRKSRCGTCRGKFSGLLPREEPRRGTPSFLV